MWCIHRHRGVEVEIYMDVNRIDVEGEWENPLKRRDPYHFPKLYDREVRAAVTMKEEELKDPSWEYRLENYYR